MRYRLLAAVILVMVAGPGCVQRGPADAHVVLPEQERTIMTLRVRLGEGFQNNTVSVRANGTQVYQRAGVTTDYSISRADGFDVPVDTPSVQLEVQLQDGPRATAAIAPAQTPFVEVRLIEGRLELQAREQEPPMM